jgi:phenylacetate-CoA ligase
MIAFWNPKAETMTPEEIRILQTERLRRVVRHVYERNETWRSRFDNARVSPDDIWGLDDLRRLPFLTKDDLVKHHPMGLVCEEPRHIREFHSGAGTTGEPLLMPSTDSDLRQWAHCMARCYLMAGAEAGDVVAIRSVLGCTHLGFGFYHGARLAGLSVLPGADLDSARAMQLAALVGARVIAARTSDAVALLNKLDPSKEGSPPFEIGIFWGEHMGGPTRKKLREVLGIEVFDLYGMTETGGVGTLGMDCRAHEGLHLWEDHYLIEIVDPASGEPLPDGEEGELVVTTLTREALPVIRYRTGDQTAVQNRGRCSCGRTHVRVAPISGRL